MSQDGGGLRRGRGGWVERGIRGTPELLTMLSLEVNECWPHGFVQFVRIH